MKNKCIIITGAAGGIASSLARKLQKEGAKLCLTDISKEPLEHLKRKLSDERVLTITADITRTKDRHDIVRSTIKHFGNIDILINSAGINPFGIFHEQDESIIDKAIEINLIAPMLMTRLALPHMLINKTGQIVNIGSTFGSLGFACFSAYSASKFGLRGFSQALRRELYDTNIKVTYIAPRAVKTAINSDKVIQMAEEINMKMDEPNLIASKIINAIKKQKKEHYIGIAESFFTKVNSIAPSLVDRAIIKQSVVSKKYAKVSE